MHPLDSTVLAYTMKLLNQRHDYGVDLVLLSIDEGITGYRDDSLEVCSLCSLCSSSSSSSSRVLVVIRVTGATEVKFCALI